LNEIGTSDLIRLFGAIADAVEAERDDLCRLDGVIGDADHGITMALGFSSVRSALAALDSTATDLTAVFNTAAKSFLNAVGASSGPLYATAFMRAGAAVKGEVTLDRDRLVTVIAAMARGIQERGKGQRGEKTMLDAWLPAAEAAETARAGGQDLQACVDAALSAAMESAEATKDMIATKGRSARLGDRAIGHMDPGAASAVVILRTLAKVVAA
jgi:dihydroxyacetone kinase-like protein